MRKEKVTPRGKPARVKAMNNGMDEQAQKGVTVPSSAPHHVATKTFETPKNALASFGWKVALNIADDENHHTKQYNDFYGVIDKKMKGSTPSRRSIQTKRIDEYRNQIREPLHLKKLIH